MSLNVADILLLAIILSVFIGCPTPNLGKVVRYALIKKIASIKSPLACFIAKEASSGSNSEPSAITFAIDKDN